MLSNILLTPFDQEMRRKGYQLTRYADDWVITCKSVAEARAALAAATRVLEQLDVRLNPQKTRIVHVQQGFDFLGYRIVWTQKKRQLPASMIRSRLHPKVSGIGGVPDGSSCHPQNCTASLAWST